jgi:3-oxoacyl-(acyl-carrier-protein) synthase
MSVVIGGTGAVCAAGTGVATGFRTLCSGEHYLKPYLFTDHFSLINPLCAEVTCDLELLVGREGLYKSLAMALIAGAEAMSMLQQPENLSIGVIAATTFSSLSQIEQTFRQYLLRKEHIEALAIDSAVYEPSVLAAEVCRTIGGSSFHVVTTEGTAGTQAIGIGMRMVEHGHYDACLVIGSDALSDAVVHGYMKCDLVDREGCKPFDKDRAGMTPGEGAAALLLLHERFGTLSTLKKRIAVTGWGACTAERSETDNAIPRALSEARLQSSDIDLIVANGSGIVDRDANEIATYRSVFETLPPFCSMKRTLGYTFAASGILESVFAVNALIDGYIPPTAGFSTFDDTLGFSPSSSGPAPLRNIVKYAAGFLSTRDAIILSAEEV